MFEESLLGDELFRRRHCMGAEIVMPDAGNAHEALGRLDQAIQPLAECKNTRGTSPKPTS